MNKQVKNAEQRLYEVWDWAQVRLAEPFEGVAKEKWVARLPLLPFSQIGFDTRDEAVSAALAYTEQVLEQARQMRWEISLLKLLHYNMDNYPLEERNPHDHDEDQRALERAYKRIESLYFDKVRRIRPEALQ